MSYLIHTEKSVSDRPGRTLLAWQRLTVNPLFHGWWSYAATVTVQSAVQDIGREGDDITSEERKEQRYQRRVAKRSAHKQMKYAKNDNYDWVFSYRHLYDSYRKCRRNVGWKASVQRYVTNAPLNIWNTYSQLQAGTYRTKGFFEFDIYERGKKRHIKSVTIGERVVQRCLCDYALSPMISRTFIYDNGASLENKGYTFAINRICVHLREHYRKYGTDGYILLFDFSKFFDRVSHELIKGILRKEFTDKRILELTEHFIDAFGEEGMGLGSQISQILALSSANELDHYVKDIARIRGYGRYMDDGYLIHHSKEYLQKCLAEINSICEKLGIKLNQKKTHIVKLSHGFTWLKVRFFLLPSGKVVKKIYRRSVVKERRKIKKFKELVSSGDMTMDDAYTSWQSWKSYASKFNAWHTIQNMETLFINTLITDGRELNVFKSSA